MLSRSLKIENYAESPTKNVLTTQSCQAYSNDFNQIRYTHVAFFESSIKH
jgi:hypothetical protein